MKFCSVFIPCKNSREAKKIAKHLLESHLVACANILPGMESMFLWNGKIERASEVLLMLKSKQSCLKKLKEQAKKLHSYECPVIEMLEIKDGNQEFFSWMDREGF